MLGLVLSVHVVLMEHLKGFLVQLWSFCLLNFNPILFAKLLDFFAGLVQGGFVVGDALERDCARCISGEADIPTNDTAEHSVILALVQDAVEALLVE